MGDRCMTKVILFGEQKDRKLAEFLLRNLSKFFHVCLYHSPDSILEFGEGEELLVIETGSVHRAFSNNTIILLLPGAHPETLEAITGSVFFVVRSSMHAQLRRLAKKGIPAVTCGLSGKDTVTVSSYLENNITVALQRELQTVKGELIEPMELLFQTQGETDQHDVLVLASLLLLTGVLNAEKTGELPRICLS